MESLDKEFNLIRLSFDITHEGAAALTLNQFCALDDDSVVTLLHGIKNFQHRGRLAEIRQFCRENGKHV